tara:strand:+ start:195 stop:341 length:147 start_codon:yes stop_codon:yes gene_type:complete
LIFSNVAGDNDSIVYFSGLFDRTSQAKTSVFDLNGFSPIKLPAERALA